MDLGTRSIRSSGRGSGSIEITLPSRVRALSGLPCRVSWQDAPVPQLTLTPDLSAARDALARLWGLTLEALVLPPQPLPALRIGFHGETLRWEDAILLSGPGPHEATPVSRVLASLLDLARPGAAPGGTVALAYLATGAVADSAHQADCAIAARVFPHRAAAPLDAFGAPLWQAVARLAPAMQALQGALAAQPARLAALRRAAGMGAPLDMAGLLS